MKHIKIAALVLAGALCFSVGAVVLASPWIMLFIGPGEIWGEMVR